MAVDTRRKRFSILTLGNIIQPVSLTPDGTIDQGDRQHLLWGYSGIAWASGPDRRYWRRRGRRFSTSGRRR